MLAEFNVTRVKDIEEAVALMAKGGHKVVAGGTDIIPSLRNMENAGTDLVDITAIPGLDNITEEKNTVYIGPLVTFTDILRSDIIRKRCPLLQKALENAGSVQIRNRATVGGNICNASPAADSVPALVALDARLEITGPKGFREIPVTSFIAGPKRTNIAEGEILTRIIVHSMEKTEGYSFLKLGRRKALAISRMNVAVVIALENGKIIRAAISPGSVMPAPCRIKKAEDLLIDKAVSEEIFDAAGREVAGLMLKKSGRRWSSEYKMPVIQAMVRRALMEAARIAK
ncbi:MAG: FAD binding domain-containing protein [Elusimicrobiota bacterium]